MKKVLLSAILLAGAATMFAQKTWNFSNTEKFPAQTFSTTTIIDGLKIMATADATVAIDANTKKHGTYSFTQRLKLGGSGGFTAENRYMPTTRALVFQVSGPSLQAVAQTEGCCLLMEQIQFLLSVLQEFIVILMEIIFL